MAKSLFSLRSFHLLRPLIHSNRQLHVSTGLCRDHLTLRSQQDGIRRIILNDTKKRNALSLSMLEDLKRDLETDVEDVRVVIISAQGPVFSAGHDLKELTSAQGREHHERVFRKCTEVMTLIQTLPAPVIAQVQGLATAAGCQLVASCDIAIAAETARFATPGVSVGLFCSTPGVALVRAVPRKVAMEMLLTGQPITAQDALSHGLVSRVVPADELEEQVTAIAKRICETSQSVNALGKAFFYRQIQLSQDQAYREGEKVMADNLSLVDGQEGIKAFIEKRLPHWTHGTDKAH